MDFKSYFFPYSLRSQSSLNALHKEEEHSGALLKFIFEDGKVGYADCNPWQQFGDAPLQKQLELLKRGVTTKLTKNALHFARLDAEAREAKRALLETNPNLLSHFLIPDLAKINASVLEKIAEEGFSHVKIKVGRDLKDEREKLLELFKERSIKIRLDFNQTLDLKRFQSFLLSIAPLQSKIDFIEDPFPFHSLHWKEIQSSGWTLAADRCAEEAMGDEEAAKVIIFKPAIDAFPVVTHQRIVVTSYMGHPLEQLSAAYSAKKMDPNRQECHGLLSHRVYEKNIFSEALAWKGCFFIPPEGEGFGFGQRLEKLSWRE